MITKLVRRQVHRLLEVPHGTAWIRRDVAERLLANRDRPAARNIENRRYRGAKLLAKLQKRCGTVLFKSGRGFDGRRSKIDAEHDRTP